MGESFFEILAQTVVCLNMKYSLILLMAYAVAYSSQADLGHTVKVINSKSNFGIEHIVEGVIEDGPYGGNGGEAFTDGGTIHLNGPPAKIDIRAKNYIDAIRFTYGDTDASWHGGSGGHEGAGTCQLDEGEQIIIVQGGAHKYIDRLEFITSKGKVCGPYGGRNGDAFVSSFPGCFLSYISGASHNYIDSLIFHWECPDVDSQ